MFPSRQPFLLLVFWSSFYDVAFAKRCPDVQTKAGDTVLLQSCHHEQVSEAGWKWNYTKVINMEKTWSVPLQFKDRIELNQNLSLTVKNAGLQDRGVFTFISYGGIKQWPTIEVHLVVHETISEELLLSNNITWHAVNSSCTVQLDCSSHSSASFNWTVGGVTQAGRRLQRVIRPENGDVMFTCTAFNPVSEKSASESVRCTKDTTSSRPGTDPVNILTPVIAACSSLIILMVVLSVSVYCCKRKSAEGDQDEQTIYAVIDDVRTPDVKPAEEDGMVFYESINNINNSVQTVPQTVYDEIQKSRIMVDSTSPYQTAGP